VLEKSRVEVKNRASVSVFPFVRLIFLTPIPDEAYITAGVENLRVSSPEALDGKSRRPGHGGRDG
jgi:hypothetical protein